MNSKIATGGAAGVEATMSEFDRRSRVKRVRVRGLKAVRLSATLKALGLNILRAAAVMAAMIAWASNKATSKCSYRIDFSDFKERFWTAFGYFVRLLVNGPNYTSIYPKRCFG